MELKPGYKMTEVGVVPEGWEVAQLGAIAILERGKFTARPRNDPRLYGGVFPFIQTGDVTNCNGSIESYTQTLNESGLRVSRLFPRGTLFFTIAANIGDVAFATFATACPDSLVGISPTARVDMRWLFQVLKSHQSIFESLATKNAQLNISLEKLRPYLLPAPPLPEQEAIAAALGDVDALIGSLDRLIAKKSDLKQAAMQQLLTGQTRLPGFSGEWEETKLGHVGLWKGGMTPSMSDPSYWEGGTIPWASSGDIKVARISETPFTITDLAIKHGTTTLVPPNSLLVVTRSGILRRHLPVALNTNPIAINQDIKALVPYDWADPGFLLHLLTERGPEILSRCMKSGTTVESIELSWLKAFAIRFPMKNEQTAIAEVLSDMDAEIAALEARREKTRLLKQGMMQELLTGRTRLV